MDSVPRPTAAYEYPADGHDDARLPPVPTPTPFYADEANSARRPPGSHSHAPRQQGSKDSSSDTPSDRGSAGASSATSLATLDPDDAPNPSTPESKRQAIKPLKTSPARSGAGRAASPTPLQTPTERTPMGQGAPPESLLRHTSQRSVSRTPSQRGGRSASRRSSLAYVSGVPPPSRSSSVHVGPDGSVVQSPALDHLASTRVGLSRTPSTSSTTSGSCRATARSSSFRYNRTGAPVSAATATLGTSSEDVVPSPSPSLSSVSTARMSTGRTLAPTELNTVRQPTFEGDTLVSRSHDMLSEIAARERTLLDLKEEVKKQETELEELRKRWQQSITSTLAHDPQTPAGSSNASPAKPSTEPARQAADTIRGWGDKLGSLFDASTSASASGTPTAETVTSETMPEPSGTPPTTGKQDQPTPKHNKRQSIFGMMFAPSDGIPSIPSRTSTDSIQSIESKSSSESTPATNSVPAAGGWFSRSWKKEPKPAPAPPGLPGKGPRIENGIVMDNVEEGQPMRIFLEELAEEDESTMAKAGDRTEPEHDTQEVLVDHDETPPPVPPRKSPLVS